MLAHFRALFLYRTVQRLSLLLILSLLSPRIISNLHVFNGHREFDFHTLPPTYLLSVTCCLIMFRKWNMFQRAHCPESARALR